jgi:hypothetical protein
MKVLNSKLNIKRRGLSIIEVIVAIGISVVTITGAAQFSLNLVHRAQENFVEESALELQTLINEQLRFLEFMLRKDIKDSNPSISNRAAFCSTNQLGYFKMNLPNFDGSSNNLTLSAIPQTGNAVIVDSDSFYFSDPFSAAQNQYNRFGAFDRVDDAVQVSIKKEVNPGSNPTDNFITLKTVVKYDVFGTAKYTKIQETKMIYSLVCP